MDIEEDEDTKYCTNCKHHIKSDVYQMHILHCHRKITLCPVCDEAVPKDQLEQHHEDNHTETSCDMCGRKILKDKLEDHQTTDCPERKIGCSYCQLEVKAIDYMEHVAVCGSRTDVCEKCLTRLMLKDMDTHKCGDLQPLLQRNPYRAPPKPRPVVMGAAASIDIGGPGVGVAIPPPYVARDEREEVEGGEKFQVNDQLLRDEEMAAALHAQYLNEDSHHPLSPPCPHPLSPHSPHPLSPHSPHPQYSPHVSHSPSPAPQPDDNNLLNEQLQFEERAGVRGQPTMVLYNYAVNGEGGTNPCPSSSDEAPSQATPPELEGEEEERRRRQLLDDEEMARQLQEEEDQETNRLIARLRQEEPVPHTLAQSPPPAYNAIEEEERRRRREREEEEEEILIPCDVCGASIRFEDYQKHMDERHSRLATYIRNTHSPPPQRNPSPEPAAQPSANNDVPCSYCGFRYAPDVLGYHETICDMNPEKDLIKTSSNAIRPNVPTFLPPSPEPQPPVLPPLQEVEPLESAAGDDGIPCQFCDKAFPLHEIERHQKSCPVRFAPHNLETDIGHFAMRSGPGGASSLTENKAECTYCRKLVLFSKLSTHEEICFKRPRASSGGASMFINKSTTIPNTDHYTESDASSSNHLQRRPLRVNGANHDGDKPRPGRTSLSPSPGASNPASSFRSLSINKHIPPSSSGYGGAGRGKYTSTEQKMPLVSDGCKRLMMKNPESPKSCSGGNFKNGGSGERMRENRRGGGRGGGENRGGQRGGKGGQRGGGAMSVDLTYKSNEVGLVIEGNGEDDELMEVDPVPDDNAHQYSRRGGGGGGNYSGRRARGGEHSQGTNFSQWRQSSHH